MPEPTSSWSSVPDDMPLLDAGQSATSWGAVAAGAPGAAAMTWPAFTQIALSAVGGCLAGRLRIKGSRISDDEVYFRDSAHGFLAW